MRYMLVNVSSGILSIDLCEPNLPRKVTRMHKYVPTAPISIPAGESVDILKFFGGSLERAHAAVKYSRGFSCLFRPQYLKTFVCNDNGEIVDVEKLLAPVDVSELSVDTLPKPTLDVGIQDLDKEIATIVKQKAKEEILEKVKISSKLTYMRYTETSLSKLSKLDLIKLAKSKFNLDLEKKFSKDTMIAAILGAQ